MNFAYHCAQTCASDKVKFPIHVADLVPRLPRRTEEGNRLTIGILELQERGASVQVSGAKRGTMKLTITSPLVVLGRQR